MSHGRAIDPLPLEGFPTEQDASDPGFEALFADLVGDAGTPADGFEDDVAIANSLLDSLDAGLSLLSGQEGGTLDEAFVEILAVDADAPGEDIANLTTALPDVQSNVDNLGNLLTGAALPTPPTPGTGGMTLQTATGPILPYDARQGFGPGACSGYPCQDVVPFHNPSQNDYTIDSIVLVGPPGGPWTVTTDAQPSFPPGKQYNLKIVANVQPAASDVAQVQIHVHGVAAPAVFQMDGGIGSTGGGGGGGGGPIRIVCPECG